MHTSRTEPDAIVFIPGIFRSWEGSVVEGLGDRLKVALERNAPSPLHFDASPTTNTFPGPFGVTEVVKLSVSLAGDNQVKALVDLYSLDAAGRLTESYKVASTVKKALHLGFHILTLVPRIAFYFFGRKQDLRGKIQLVLGSGVIIVMQLSFLILIATLVAGFATLTPASNEWRAAVVNWALPFAAALLGVLALIPQKIRSALDSFTVFILSFIGYVSAGIQRDAAVGNLASFLECLEENCQYRRVHIVSFGMGTVIALDSLYPRGQPILRFKVVDTLVTIACPADIILGYWPQYFTDRRRLEGVPRHWMNVFVPSDLLASNFIDGDSYIEGPEERKQRKRLVRLPTWSGIRVRGQSEVIHPDTNVRHALTSLKGGVSRVFAAVRAHQAYWDRTSITSASVFDTIVQELFPAGDWDS